MKKIKVFIGSLVGLLTLTPALALAASTLPQFQSSWTLSDIIDWCLSLMNLLIPLLIGAAVICFLYGVLRFIAKSSAGDADGRKEAINFMIFGIIGIAVMVSVWGLVAFVTNTFGVSSVVPQFNSLKQGVDSPNDTLLPGMIPNNT